MAMDTAALRKNDEIIALESQVSLRRVVSECSDLERLVTQVKRSSYSWGLTWAG